VRVDVLMPRALRLTVKRDVCRFVANYGATWLAMRVSHARDGNLSCTFVASRVTFMSQITM